MGQTQDEICEPNTDETSQDVKLGRGPHQTFFYMTVTPKYGGEIAFQDTSSVKEKHFCSLPNRGSNEITLVPVTPAQFAVRSQLCD